VSGGCSGARRDPPRLVPWNRIGDIRLGEAKKDVEADYGSAGHGYHVHVADQGIVEGYYRLHGSRVDVTFENGRVSEIAFSTRYYRTKDGFGVGSRIPAGRHRWHGFLWNAYVRERPCGCWVKVGRGSTSLPATAANFGKPWTFLSVDHGRVTGIYFALKFVD
jgi:hypothetical protein